MHTSQPASFQKTKFWIFQIIYFVFFFSLCQLYFVLWFTSTEENSSRTEAIIPWIVPAILFLTSIFLQKPWLFPQVRMKIAFFRKIQSTSPQYFFLFIASLIVRESAAICGFVNAFVNRGSPGHYVIALGIFISLYLWPKKREFFV